MAAYPTDPGFDLGESKSVPHRGRVDVSEFYGGGISTALRHGETQTFQIEYRGIQTAKKDLILTFCRTFVGDVIDFTWTDGDHYDCLFVGFCYNFVVVSGPIWMGSVRLRQQTPTP